MSAPEPKAAPGKKALRPLGEWNTYHIVYKGSRLITVLNGKVLKPVGPLNMPVYNVSLSPEALRKREEAAVSRRKN